MMEEVKAQERKSRTLESREMTFKRQESWQEPEALPMPDKRPGWEHRYIRVSMMGLADPKNVSSKFREGYEPVRASDYPELMMHEVVDGRFKGGIEIGGLVLCRIPTEFLHQRDEVYRRKNQSQMESVDNQYMSDKSRYVKQFAERKSDVTFGSGKH